MKIKIIFYVVALIFILAALPGCQAGENSSAPVVITPVQFVTGEEVAELVKGNNSFALNLYQKFSKSQTGNFVYSPYSISCALAMTYAGAKGETAKQMADVLRFTLPDTSLPTAFRDLQQDMEQRDEAENKVQLDIANALWGQEGESFLPEYVQLINTYYSGFGGPQIHHYTL
jgi:serine protease inhibitor